MKKIISVLLITVFLFSILTAVNIPVFAEGSADVSVNEESDVWVDENNSTEVSDESEDDDKNDDKFANTKQSLLIMGFGMVGIFLVTAIIVCFMYLLTLFKDKKE